MVNITTHRRIGWPLHWDEHAQFDRDGGLATQGHHHLVGIGRGKHEDGQSKLEQPETEVSQEV